MEATDGIKKKVTNRKETRKKEEESWYSKMKYPISFCLGGKKLLYCLIIFPISQTNKISSLSQINLIWSLKMYKYHGKH